MTEGLSLWVTAAEWALILGGFKDCGIHSLEMEAATLLGAYVHA